MALPYRNRIWLQGQVMSTPTKAWVSARTRVTTFRLATVEGWYNDRGEWRERKNYALVEVLGRDAEWVGATVKPGSWVSLEGYLRSEQVKGQEVTKVRTLAIDVWGHNHAEKNSRGAPDRVSDAEVAGDER
jgi:single-stranded DNA-binding protein